MSLLIHLVSEESEITMATRKQRGRPACILSVEHLKQLQIGLWDKLKVVSKLWRSILTTHVHM